MNADFPTGSIPKFKRCAHYGRYSTRMQRPASLEDQLRLCQESAERKGWKILDEHIYADAGLSGRTKAGRKGLEALEAAAQQRPCPFDYILFDDTSRLSRDLGDVLQFEKMMRHYGVQVCFVSQQLDSNDPNFLMLLSVHGIVDSQTISRLQSKVHAAQKGRVLAGFVAGSWPYGYRPIVVASEDSIDAIGRAATAGTKLEIVENEASIIRRIFTLFTEGRSMWNICVTLNDEKVPSPRHVRAGGKASEWSRDAIKRILGNEKYRGIYVWNASKRLKHPRTGQVRKEPKPAQEHIRMPHPELRIVDDDLWNKVVERRRYLDANHNARLLGGWNRAKNKTYLYSGLLHCGECGSRMKIGGKDQRAYYECPNQRYHRGCTNRLRIREDKAAKRITQVIVDRLFHPEDMEFLIAAVWKEVQALQHKQALEFQRSNISTLQAQHKLCLDKIGNIVSLIESSGSPTLVARLQELEFEKTRLEEKVAVLKGAARAKLTKEEIRIMVEQNVTNLLEVLKTDPQSARPLLHRHIKKLLLFPGETERGPMFEVIGEADLFGGPVDSENDVLLRQSSTQTPQQHINCPYYFELQLFPNDEECLFVEPLYRLLQKKPELSAGPRVPGEWAKLLREEIDDWDSRNSLGSGAVGRCLGRHWKLLSERFEIVKGKNTATNGWHYQISIRSPSARDPLGEEVV